MRTQDRSVAEAEAWARSLGVVVDYGERLDLANLCNELLAQLEQRSLLLPDRIEVSRALFEIYGNNLSDIPASSREGRLAVNPDAVVWTNPAVFGRMLRKQRFWSSDDPLHALYHEAGHILHYKADPARYNGLAETDLTPKQKTLVAGEVKRMFMNFCPRFSQA